MGIANPSELDWLDAPPDVAVTRAEDLLERLGATGELARRMARYPLHPRLARMVIDAVDRGAGEEGCRAAAALSAGARSPSCDLLSLIDSPVRSCDATALRADPPHRPASKSGRPTIRTRWRSAILTAFPDRVARRRKDNQLLLASGGSAVLACESRAEFLVALDIEDRSEHALPLVRLYCAIEPGMAARPVSRSSRGTGGRGVESFGGARGRSQRSAVRESDDRRDSQRSA